MDLHQAIMDELNNIKRLIAESDMLRREALEMELKFVNEDIKAARKDPLADVGRLKMKRQILELELELMDLKRNVSFAKEGMV